MKQQAIEMTPEARKWYTENFPTNRQGVTRIVEAVFDSMKDNPMTDLFDEPDIALHFCMQTWKQMYRHSLAGIKGMFSAGELSLLIDTHNGLMLSPWQYGATTLAAGTSDAIALDGLAEKWDIDPQVLLEKIHGLTPTQAMCLEMWACGFWVQHRKPDPVDFRAYVAAMV